MTKEEALNKIDELKKFVEDCDKVVKPNVVTHFPTADNSDGYINGKWVFSIDQTEEQGDNFSGCDISGHKASMFLVNSHGTWFTEDGTQVQGYLFYKPNDR